MKFFLFIVMLVSNTANANEFKHLQSDSYWTFKKGDNPKNSNGRSREYTYTGQNVLLEVEIAIKVSLENEIDLLKHELGHALGLDDDTTGSAVVMRHSRMY